MTKHLTLLLFIGLAWGQNPCDDKRFLSLGNKSLDDMSQREYEYYMMMQEKCQSFDKQLNSQILDNIDDYYDMGLKRGKLQAGNKLIGISIFSNLALPVIGWSIGSYYIKRGSIGKVNYRISKDNIYKKIHSTAHKELYENGFDDGYKKKIKTNWNYGSLAGVIFRALIHNDLN